MTIEREKCVAYFIAVFSQLADIIIVFISDPIDLLQNLSLNTVRLGITSGPFRGIVVLGLHDIIERRDLHVTIERYDFALLEDLVDLREVNASLGI